MTTQTVLAARPDAGHAVPLEFLSAAMHHGRNLVMSTRGYAELIAGQQAPDEKRGEWAGRIVRNLDRLEELYCRLDDLREEASTGREVVSLALAIECGCRQAVSRVRDRGIEAKLKLRLEADPLVDANGHQISRAVAAFVENAIEADPNSTACVGLLRTDDGAWALSIDDEGEGIEEEDRKRYGDAFFTRKAGRMGMGVFVGRSLLDRLGMVFTLTTEPHRGTRITIQPRRGR